MKSTDFQHFLPELLGQIFEECLPDFGDQRISRISSASQAPLKLGRVCSHWRQVALSTPALWDRIDLTKSNYAENEQEVANVNRIAALKAQVFFGKVGLSPSLDLAVEPDDRRNSSCHSGTAATQIKVEIVDFASPGGG